MRSTFHNIQIFHSNNIWILNVHQCGRNRNFNENQLVEADNIFHEIKHQIGHRSEISDLEIKETKALHKMARSPPTAFQLGDGPKWPRSLLQIRQFYLRAKRTNKSFWWVNIGMISATADSYLQTAAKGNRFQSIGMFKLLKCSDRVPPVGLVAKKFQ